MISREDLHNAVKAIARRDPEMGYALGEMLKDGLVDASRSGEPGQEGDRFLFWFEDQRVAVSKYIYLSEGSAILEQLLVAKYGEALKKQELLQEGRRIDLAAARLVREAGLDLLVEHELRSLTVRLEDRRAELVADDPRRARLTEALAALERLGRRPGEVAAALAEHPASLLYVGVVGAERTGHFATFPRCRQALCQVAGAGLEFFHLRLVLACLLGPEAEQLFACLVEDRVVGLILLAVKRRFLSSSLEIKYLATLNAPAGQDPAAAAPAEVRGAGALLVAGAWLHWQNGFFDARELELDSEVEARGFYQNLGFNPRGMAQFVLKYPRGRLARSILVMANRCLWLAPRAVRAICAILDRQAANLAHPARSPEETSRHRLRLQTLREALRPGARPEFRRAAREAVLRRRKRIVGAEELLALGAQAEDGSEGGA